MIGKTISHYDILDKLGEGGMGVVYKARDTRLDRTVALKFLPSHLACDDDAGTRFEHEAKAASATDHPNIATVYDIDEVEGKRFISMACIEGESLKEVIAGRHLPVDEVLEIAAQIAEGLKAAHGKGVIHRDVKSDNIMVAGDGLVKIMDFGLAMLRGGSRVTKMGSTLGTIAYMSPEQAQGQEVDHRSDIFSFGVVLYEMLAGALPFPAEHEAALLYSIVNADPRPIAEIRDDVPPELRRIVAKALEKDRETRYQSVEEMLTDVKRLRSFSMTGQHTSKRNFPTRRALLLPAIAASVVILVLMVGIRIQLGNQPTAEAADNGLAVMYFENLSDPDDGGRLGEMITNLVIANLSDSRHIRVFSSQRLYDVMRLLGEEDRKAIDRDVASRVAEKAGAQWMVQGSILRAEPRLTVTAQVVEVATGDAIASQRITAEKGEDVFVAADRLSAEIKRDLSLQDEAGSGEQLSAPDVTTRSVEAYRHYLEGIERWEKLYISESRESFEKALAADSTFAMAYYWLAFLSSDEEAKPLNARALEYADNASELERLYIRVQEAGLSMDRDKRIELLERIVELYPEEKYAHFELASIYYDELRQLDEALEHYKLVIEIDPLHKLTYNQLAYLYDDMGNFEKSMRAIDRYIEIAPDEPNPYDSKGELYARNGKLREAAAAFEKALEIDPGYRLSLANLGFVSLFRGDYSRADSIWRDYSCYTESSCRSAGRLALAAIPAHQGKLKASLNTLNDAIAADSLIGDVTYFTSLKYLSKALIYMERGDPDAAMEEAAACVDLNRRLYPDAVLHMRHFYVIVLSECGNIAEAERVARELKEDIEEKDVSLMSYYWVAAASLERSGGDAETSLAYLRRAAAEGDPPDFPLRYYTASVLVESGRLGEAVTELENALSMYGESMHNFPVWSVKGLYLLGLCYERSGWSNKAIEQYERFLDVWKDADPGMAAVEDAKERLERLRRTS
jgi:serine/threonine protein kinase/tetratricopeptide (TPR) repeat protein